MFDSTEDMSQISRRKVLFLTGTRADFGKLKPLVQILHSDAAFEVYIFVTGMHMLSKYGYTCLEVEKSGFDRIHKYINQNSSDGMDHILAKTISGLSDYVKETRPNLIVVHGDRIEALAGAIVGALNNILTGHIEGGEVSGTVDELIRHAVTKLSHVHFVANGMARSRLTQLGEREETIHVIGSPDIDVMESSSLPDLDEVKQYYGIHFPEYAILLFHPVTSEFDDLHQQVNVIVDEVIESGLNYVVIYPNNDPGTDIILNEYRRFEGNPRFRIYPSMRFEYFLTLLKNARVIVGNSSCGIREAPHFGVPAINIGSRQHKRVSCGLVVDVAPQRGKVAASIRLAERLPRRALAIFGDGKSADRFHGILTESGFWSNSTQKFFVDRLLPTQSIHI